MHPLLTALLVILGIALLAFGAWLYMICPGRKRREMDRFKTVKYAHRGLHDGEKPENSMAAFAAAKEHGFGIELDIRLSKDGVLMVFHDDTLNRVVGIDGKVIDFTAEELGKMSLLGTAETIPTFRQVLDLIDGAVPLLIEIKNSMSESGVAEKFIEEIEGYKGEFIVESFNPMALRTVKKARPDVLRGILSMRYQDYLEPTPKPIGLLLENLYMNFLMRPDFISYDKRGYCVHNLRIIRRSLGTPLIAWTIRSEEEEAQAISHGFDTVIFEGYIPEK